MPIKYQTTLLKELLALKEVIDAGQIYRAAEKNGIRQTNYSKMLKDLEDRFGITLFQRTSTGLIPTNAARSLYSEIQSIDTALNNIETSYVKEKNLTGDLNIWIDESFAEHPILTQLSLFYARYPKISLHLLTDKKVDARSVDIAIVEKSRNTLPPQSSILFESETVIRFYTSRKYLEKQGQPKNLQDLLENYDICMRQYYLNLSECYFIIKQAQHLNTISDSRSLILRLIHEGNGIALAPDWAQNIYPDLVPLENVEFALLHRFAAYTLTSENSSPKLKLFINFLRESVSEQNFSISFS